MPIVKCSIEYSSTENDNGYETDCIFAECTKCGHVTMSYGHSEESVKRCLALMNEECPKNENNFYKDEDD
jgi:ribosomal protein S27E